MANMETSRLVLRPFLREDSEALHALWIAPGMRKFLWDDEVISAETAADVIESSIASFGAESLGFWALHLLAGGELIGFCGLRRFQDDHSTKREVEILYGLAEDFQHRGLATEAAAAVLHYGFARAGLERIYAGADPPNTASIRVMDRLGMRFAKRALVGGISCVFYAIDRSDFRPEKHVRVDGIPASEQAVP